MTITNESVLSALTHVIEPDLKKDVVSLGLVSEMKIDGATISFKLLVNNPALHNKKRIEEACLFHVQRLHGDVDVTVRIEAMPQSNLRDPKLRTVLPGVKHIIAVSSGKGGVGKSTITANLAVGLVKLGYKVGLIDADIYGPSMPVMFDVVFDKPKVKEVDGKSYMLPVESYGVKMLSIGFFSDSNQAIAWRGPMATKALTQMINDVYWGELDYMLLDLPPGTGDIHLSLVQGVPLSGAIIVSTPQPVALADARKGIAMFRMPSINVKVLGIVENMSWFTPAELPTNRYYIFGQDGAIRLAEQLGVPVLGQIPLVQSIREASDAGRPAILQDNQTLTEPLNELVKNVVKAVEESI